METMTITTMVQAPDLILIIVYGLWGGGLVLTYSVLWFSPVFITMATPLVYYYDDM